MRAYGNWVLMKHTESTTDSGIISNQGSAMTVLAIGGECPEEFKTLISKKVYYKEHRSALPVNGYICVHWQDIIYTEGF